MRTTHTIGAREAAGAAVGAPPRDRFSSRLGVLAATLGSAVGLGNIWKFPFLTGANGGAAFIMIYLVSTLLIGLPIMIAEIALGRRARANAVATLERLAPPRQPWWLIGVAGVLSGFLILAFYTEVAAWVFVYMFKAAVGAVSTTDPGQAGQHFQGLISDPLLSLAGQWGVLLLVGSIIVLGASRGIERTTKRLMPLLLVLLVLIGVRSLTLPGAGAGLAFLLRPDFSHVSGATVLTAMGLAFFKLSIGMGAMITYGSYFRDDQDIPATAARVMLADLAISMLAGVAIFPAVFAFGFEPGAGPALLFITIPAVFAGMPFGGVCVVLFFALAAMAATGAMLSLMEVPVAFLQERLRLTRLQATAATVLPLALVGATAALSNGLLAGVTIAGMTFFDLYDFLTSNVLLPLGGLGVALFVGWVWGFEQFRQALEGAGVSPRVLRLLFGVTRLVTPVLVLIVLLNGLKLF